MDHGDHVVIGHFPITSLISQIRNSDSEDEVLRSLEEFLSNRTRKLKEST